MAEAPTAVVARRFSLLRRSWTPAVLAVVLAVVVGLPALTPSVRGLDPWLFGVVFLGALVAEAVPIHLERGRQTWTLSSIEVVIVVVVVLFIVVYLVQPFNSLLTGLLVNFTAIFVNRRFIIEVWVAS